MDSYELLFQYQLIDIEVDRLDQELKRSPMRMKLVKQREFLIEQQNVIRRFEEEVVTMADRIDALKDAIARAQDQLIALQQRFDAEPPEDSKGLAAYMADAKRISDTLSAFEKEITKIGRDAADREKQDHDVRVHAARVKAEFAKLKAEYDVVYQEQVKRLQAARAQAEENAKGISPEMMATYRSIKMHSVPPLARLVSDKCGGCNMSLPSAIVRAVKAGTPTECENCGRLIIGVNE